MHFKSVNKSEKQTDPSYHLKAATGKKGALFKYAICGFQITSFTYKSELPSKILTKICLINVINRST